MIRQLLAQPVIRLLLGLVILVGLIHLFSALTRDRVLQYVAVTVTSPHISAELDGYTAAFLTDIHGTSRKTLEQITEELTARSPDIILMGGDYSGQRDLPAVFELMARIGAPDGVWGVAGNHDKAPLLREAMETHGAVLLENEGVMVREGLFLAGTEDLWRGEPDVEKALEGAGEDDFVLMICHNPDTSITCDFSRVDLALAGHTHGGEVVLFGLWTPTMYRVSRYGHRFRSGWAEADAGTGVYVSNGIGKHLPLRVFAPPQVILVTLRAQEAEQ